MHNHRELLVRQWEPSLPRVLFVMLNPSTADDFTDDNTSRKCVGFATRLGFGSISIVNLYTYRATSPDDLKVAGYPNSANADSVIRRAASEIETAICAWGSNARGHARVGEVLEILDSQNCRPMALRLSKDGTPWHPLYVPYTETLKPLPW